MNMMLVSVTERTKEIDIRKALGAKEKTILAQFLVEYLTISSIGGISGAILGILGSNIVLSTMGSDPYIAWPVVIIAILFSILMGVIFGVTPAKKAVKLKPIDALKLSNNSKLYFKLISMDIEFFIAKKMYGYKCVTTDNYSNIVDIILESNSDLLLLDINLPHNDGFYICKEIRKESDIPIIVATSSKPDIDELEMLNLGADDFINKPYNPRILLVHINSVLKRTYGKQNSIILTHKGVKLDILKGIVSFKGNSILTVNINRVRKKLESIGVNDYLVTKRGLGYMV